MSRVPLNTTREEALKLSLKREEQWSKYAQDEADMLKCYDCKELELKLQAEQQAHNELREKLKAIQWNGIMFNSCPACRWLYESGHSADCWLNNEINRKVVD